MRVWIHRNPSRHRRIVVEKFACSISMPNSRVNLLESNAALSGRWTLPALPTWPWSRSMWSTGIWNSEAMSKANWNLVNFCLPEKWKIPWTFGRFWTKNLVQTEKGRMCESAKPVRHVGQIVGNKLPLHHPHTLDTVFEHWRTRWERDATIASLTRPSAHVDWYFEYSWTESSRHSLLNSPLHRRATGHEGSNDLFESTTIIECVHLSIVENEPFDAFSVTSSASYLLLP